MRNRLILISFLLTFWSASSQTIYKGDTLSTVQNIGEKSVVFKGGVISSDTTYISAGALLLKGINLNAPPPPTGVGPTEYFGTVTPVDLVVSEDVGTTGFLFSLNQINETAGDLNMGYSISGNAELGPSNDYTGLGGLVSIPPGQSSFLLTVTINDDPDPETDENITVTLANGAGWSIGSPSTATITIQDNDSPTVPLATVAFTDGVGNEGEIGGLTCVFTLSSPATSDIPLSVTWTGSAFNGTDYTQQPSTITILQGTSETTLSIDINQDQEVEGSESLIATILSGSGYAPGSPNSATATILDDDDSFVSCTASGGPIYEPQNASQISDPANTGKIARITTSFTCTGCTFAPNQTIVPAGGIISGSNINLNNACIENNYTQLFASNVTLSPVYENSRLSPEIFGAIAGDGGNDHSAIDALIKNSSYAIGILNGVYIKNNPSYVSRSGIFDWDMNGATVRTTSSSGFRTDLVSVDAVFELTNVSPNIYNGEFDGTNTYGRLFYLHGQPSFRFNNLYVHDYYATTTYRAVAFRFTINALSSGFVSGEFSNCTIENIIAQGDGNFNNAPAGISKAWWYSVSGINTSNPFQVIHTNNVVRNIIGDDAEAFYAIQGGGSLDHNSSWLFDNEDYRYCTRRAIKACVSNVEIRNSYFEEIPESLFQQAQQMGSMIDFFSTQSTNLIQNIWVHDNTVRTVPGERAHYYLMAFTEVTGALVENNTFITEDLSTYGTVRLGSNTASYNGALRDITIRQNTFQNSYVQAMAQYAPISADPININNNTFNFTSTDGYRVAPFRFYGSGTKGYVDFIDNDVNIDMNSPNSVHAIVSTDNGISGVVGFNADGTTVTYSNGVGAYPLFYIAGNFDSTNSVQNTTGTGYSGTNAGFVGGTQTVNNLNNSPAITIQ